MWRGHRQPADQHHGPAPLLLRKVAEVLAAKALHVAGHDPEHGFPVHFVAGPLEGAPRGHHYFVFRGVGLLTVRGRDVRGRGPRHGDGLGPEIAIEGVVQRGEVLVARNERGPGSQAEIRGVEGIEDGRGPAEGEDATGPHR